MTSPVHMDIQDSASSMSFVMPAKYSLENLPQPNDSSVHISQSEPEYVAALVFGGFASDSAIQSESEKLAKLLQKENISFEGNFRFLGYNPPYQLIDRKNEIIVRIDWKGKSK